MSTIFIYPLEGHGQILSNIKQEETSSSSSMTTLSSNGLSRILEIPLSLLDNTDSNEMPKKNTANQMFWISTNNTPKSNTASVTSATNTSTTAISGSIPIIPNDNNLNTTTNGEVTHSFANRKRSIVKRRKSVLSAVYTAEEETVTIRNDKEETFAVTSDSMHLIITTEEEEGQKKRRNQNIALAINDKEEDSGCLLTPKKDNIMMNATTTSPVSRGPSFLNDAARGVKSKFQRSLFDAPSTTATTTTVYIQSEDNASTSESEGESEEATTAPKDSAIDLGVVASTEKCVDPNSTTTYFEESVRQSNYNKDNAFTDLAVSPIISKVLSVPPPPPTPTLTPTKSTNTKKKKSSWSPRRIFQSNESTRDSARKKKNDVCSNQEEKSKQFNISSFFSKTFLSSSTSSVGDSKKIKSKSSILMNSLATHNNTAETLPSTGETPKREIQLNRYNHTRLPIHTERAIYRLSHLKLSNPRRPLCDQVTISNLMFWYLSIISQHNNNNDYVPSAATDLMSTNTDAYIEKEKNEMKNRNNRAKLKQPRRKYTLNSNHTRKIRNHQIGPAATYGNAMDVLKLQQQEKAPQKIIRGKRSNITRRAAHFRSNNSSSEEDEEEDEEDFSDDDSFNDGNSTKHTDEGFMTDLFFSSAEQKMKKNSRKHSIFNIKKKKNNCSNDSGWLSSFATPKQHGVIHQDEDDIPLAMYQKGKS